MVSHHRAFACRVQTASKTPSAPPSARLPFSDQCSPHRGDRLLVGLRVQQLTHHLDVALASGTHERRVPILRKAATATPCQHGLDGCARARVCVRVCGSAASAAKLRSTGCAAYMLHWCVHTAHKGRRCGQRGTPAFMHLPRRPAHWPPRAKPLPPHLVGRLLVSPRRQQPLHHAHVAIACSDIQWRPSVLRSHADEAAERRARNARHSRAGHSGTVTTTSAVR